MPEAAFLWEANLDQLTASHRAEFRSQADEDSTYAGDNLSIKVYNILPLLDLDS